VPWSADAGANRQLLSALLKELSSAATGALPPSNLQRHAATIETFCRGESVNEAVARITCYDGDNDWLKRAAATLAAGSPTTAALSWELQRRAKTLDLADTFRLELIVAMRCCAHHDFSEGVRALLIDKDKTPRWQPRTLAEVTREWIEQHFVEPIWPGSKHPLSDL
jgi:hypothetical protein